MPSLSNIFSVTAALLAVAAASPVKAPGSVNEARTSHDTADTNVAKRRAQPELYTVYPSHPDQRQPAVNGIHMEVYGHQAEIQQVAIFKNIPANAKNCALVLHMGAKHQRVFVTNVEQMGSGDSTLTGIYPLTAIPPEDDVSWNTIQGLWSDDKRTGTFEFSNWDPILGASGIGSYDVPCAENLAFKLALDQLSANKTVYMQQDRRSGYYLYFEHPN